MQTAWRPLDLHKDAEELPSLLIKYTFGPSDYKVWLTDLTYLWEETLDRRSIIQRAFTLDTTIDPSEGAEQMRLLLSSIKKAIKQEEGTTLELLHDGDEKQLSLCLNIPLPGSLKALQWAVKFKIAPQFLLTRELIVPLLSQQVVGLASEQHLLQSLREKDYVIAKLAGQLQSDGVDLSNVFPRVASSKSKVKPNARHEIEKSVKGLVEFDQIQWRRRLGEKSGRATDLQDLVFRVFSSNSGEDTEPTSVPLNYNWWNLLSSIHTRRNARVSSGQDAVSSDPEDDEVSAMGPGFQRQSTPRKLQPKMPSPKQEDCGEQSQNRSEKVSKTMWNHGDSTTDESDEYPQSFKPRDVFTRASPSLANTPTTDHHHSEEAPNLEPRDRRESDLFDTEDQEKKLASVRDLLIHSDSSGPAESPTDDIRSQLYHKPSLDKKQGLNSATEARPKTKLGRIGGRRDAGINATSRSNMAKDSASLMSTVNDCLGANEKSSRRTAQVTAEAVSQTKMPAEAHVPSPQRETSPERADRKREQLKRELEGKSKAGTKKKRRF